MIVLTNQVMQRIAKKVPIQKSRQVVICAPICGYWIEFVVWRQFNTPQFAYKLLKVFIHMSFVDPYTILLFVEIDSVFHGYFLTSCGIMIEFFKELKGFVPFDEFIIAYDDRVCLGWHLIWGEFMRVCLGVIIDGVVEMGKQRV